MKFISASDYAVTFEMTREDLEMLAELCQEADGNAPDGPYRNMSAVATMFQLGIEVTQGVEMERLFKKDKPASFYEVGNQTG